jgi:hypothetical protein
MEKRNGIHDLEVFKMLGSFLFGKLLTAVIFSGDIHFHESAGTKLNQSRAKSITGC